MTTTLKRDPAAEYDARLLRQARELAGLRTTGDMLAWIRANHGSSIINEDDPSSIRAYILGVTKATLGELTRWLERIPEAHRG
jgi:hypothetical protein